MHWIRRILWRLEVLFLKDEAEGELDQELRHHLESEIQENLREGMSPADARRRALAEGYHPALLVLMAATVVILLIACGNVASLLLARGSTRAGELAVRAALGASGGRIGRQLFTESLVLGLGSGGLGTILAFWSQRIILIGLYGTLEFYVHRRTHELGVRVAMGAGSGAILGLVVWRGLMLVGVGLATGLAGAMGITRFLRSFLYQVEPTDPGTFATVVVGFLMVGSLACLLPAWRAIRLDPVRAILSE